MHPSERAVPRQCCCNANPHQRERALSRMGTATVNSTPNGRRLSQRRRTRAQTRPNHTPTHAPNQRSRPPTLLTLHSSSSPSPSSPPPAPPPPSVPAYASPADHRRSRSSLRSSISSPIRVTTSARRRQQPSTRPPYAEKRRAVSGAEWREDSVRTEGSPETREDRGDGRWAGGEAKRRGKELGSG